MRTRAALTVLLLGACAACAAGAACADRSLPVATDVTDPELAACANAIACGIVPDTLGAMNACLVGVYALRDDRASAAFARLTTAGVDCLASAVGCTQAWRCVAANDPPQACGVYLDLTGRCDGDVLTYCGAPTRLRTSTGHWLKFDCSSVGLHCLHDGMVASCGERECTSEVPQPVACEGSVTVTCEGQLGSPGFLEPMLDCALVGACCDQSGDPCAHCAARGLACTGNSVGSGCGLGHDCNPSQPPTCDGTILNVCELGVRKSYDCRAHGFAGCAYDTCVPPPTAP